MIDRYSLPEMAAVWAEQHKLAVWKEVETLALEAWAKMGKTDGAAATALRRAAVPTPDQVAAREKVTDHDLAAFVDLLGESVETGWEWIHYGLTSSDVLDTAGGVLLKEASELLLARLEDLFEVVQRRAFEHRDTVMVGRTHGIWAEPTSFGLKLASWTFELARDHQRLLRAAEIVAVGKVSGAVGSYAHTPPEIEEHVCRQLGLSIEPASSQVTMRDRHAEWLQALALVGASIERFATEVRHLQRSEVREVREPFTAGQKGSSAMPHKRNPILSERMTGLARLLRGYAQVGLENVALWHERDISHSSAERVVLPDAALVLHYMLVRFANLVDGLVVDHGRMKANLEATRGLVYSQAVLLALIEDQGLPRPDAYRIVQANAMRAWDEETDLTLLLANDPEVKLSPDRLQSCFDPNTFLANSAVVFQRLERLHLADHG